jgi:hypothetical protein
MDKLAELAELAELAVASLTSLRFLQQQRLDLDTLILQGNIKRSVDATFTPLLEQQRRDLDTAHAAGI